MNFLVVNDDGIEARGIRALVNHLKEEGNVYVFAPAVQQSGKSQSLSISDSIKAEEVEYEGAQWAMKVHGSPADCTKLGLQLCRENGISIDMVFSGVNMGSNLGKDTVYSGTVGAAMEAALDGYHAIAVSVDHHEATEFEYACKLATKVIPYVYKRLHTSIILNINTPHLPADKIKGVKFTTLGPRYYDDSFRLNNQGEYFLAGEAPAKNAAVTGSDIEASVQGFASITPLTFDYTNYNAIQIIEEWSL